MDRLDRILVLVRRHVPALRLVEKSDSPLMVAAGRSLRPFVPGFATRYTTVHGSTVYLPKAMGAFPRDALAATLAHELVHQLDQQKWGLLFYASYGVLLPAGRSARAVWERRAYAVDLMLARERGGDVELDRALDWTVELFAGSSYLWMWSGRDAARAFLAPKADAIRRGELELGEPYRSIIAAWRGPDGGGTTQP